MNTLEAEYAQRFDIFLSPVATRLEEHIREVLSGIARIDRISARAKSVSRFIEKAEKNEDGKPKYDNPMEQIQDQLGARIVTFYASDVPRVANEVRKFFHPIENKLRVPETESEFGYIGEHFILTIPSDVLVGFDSVDEFPTVFELQIKTLFQHAWAEAGHDVGYKPSSNLSALQKRKIAFTAAQAWGADQIFDELFKEISQPSE